MKHEFDNGKYAVEQTADYKLLAYRHGELWQDLTGNNLVYWMLCEIDKLKQQRSALLQALQEIDNWLVCAAIATPEDMAQSFSHMEQVASAAIAKAEGRPL